MCIEHTYVHKALMLFFACQTLFLGGKVRFSLTRHVLGRGQRSAVGVQGLAEDPINMEGCLPTQLLEHLGHYTKLFYNL